MIVELGKLCSLATLDIIGSSGFGYEFRVLESTSIGGGGNFEVKPGSELVDAYKQQARDLWTSGLAKYVANHPPVSEYLD